MRSSLIASWALAISSCGDKAIRRAFPDINARNAAPALAQCPHTLNRRYFFLPHERAISDNKSSNYTLVLGFSTLLPHNILSHSRVTFQRFHGRRHRVNALQGLREQGLFFSGLFLHRECGSE